MYMGYILYVVAKLKRRVCVWGGGGGGGYSPAWFLGHSHGKVHPFIGGGGGGVFIAMRMYCFERGLVSLRRKVWYMLSHDQHAGLAMACKR